MKKLLLIILLLLLPSWVRAQPSLPCSANNGQWVITTTTAVLWVCNSNSTAWINATAGTPSVPSGLITLVTSGSCPAGYTEISALNGKTLIGTIAANANVGTTGGLDTITPAGTNGALTFTGSSANTSLVSGGTPVGTNSIPTFTGSALATHSHELPFTKVAGGTGVLRMVASSIFGVGTSRAPESQSAAPTANTTAAAVLLSEAKSAGTPAGTISAPIFTGSALGTHQHSLVATGTINTPSFTGTQFDNRSAFMFVIFCKKD